VQKGHNLLTEGSRLTVIKLCVPPPPSAVNHSIHSGKIRHKKSRGRIQTFRSAFARGISSARIQSPYWQRFDGSSPLRRARTIASLVISSVLLVVIAERDCDNSSPNVVFLETVNPLLSCMGAKFRP
jgi:hypothetical protein